MRSIKIREGYVFLDTKAREVGPEAKEYEELLEASDDQDL